MSTMPYLVHSLLIKSETYRVLECRVYNKLSFYFANKYNLLCKGKLVSQTNRKWFANTKICRMNLRENASHHISQIHLFVKYDDSFAFSLKFILQIFEQIQNALYTQMHTSLLRLWFWDFSPLYFLTNVSMFSCECNWATSLSKTADGTIGQFTPIYLLGQNVLLNTR